MRALALAWVVLAGAFLPAWPAAAQDKDAMRRLQGVNQRLAADKAALEREKAQLARDKAAAEKERDELREDAAKQKGTAARRAAELKKLEAEAEKLRADLAAATERETALKGELAKTGEALAESKKAGEQLGRRLANQGETSRLWREKTDACEAKNADLARVGAELIDRYRAKSCGDALVEAEPFTGIAKVRAENLLEEYRERIREARFRAADAPAGKDDNKEKSR